MCKLAEVEARIDELREDADIGRGNVTRQGCIDGRGCSLRFEGVRGAASERADPSSRPVAPAGSLK
eukprot:6838508-Alexandrium_andersonii.AAC.1